MKRNWLASGLGTAALVAGTAWTQTGAAHAVMFTPSAGDAAPRSTTGGASRGNMFTPSAGEASPRGATGGASRGGLFTPPARNGAARGTTGGASRGGFFSPPPDAASPQGATGGASRGIFTDSSEALATTNSSARSNLYGETSTLPTSIGTSMLAVMPDSFFGKTVQARPTILVYVPASNASEAVFSIKDEVKDSVYERVVAIPSSGGVVAIDLPSSAPELTVDQNYQWYLALKIDGALKPSSPFVDGWVKRVGQNSEMAASTGGDAITEIEALGANGIWYDTAAKLASLQAGQDDEAISQHWYELLESVGLADIAAAPIVMEQ